MSIYTQDENGNWVPAQPIGWREEHNLWQRFLLWVLRRPHCCDEEPRA